MRNRVQPTSRTARWSAVGVVVVVLAAWALSGVPFPNSAGGAPGPAAATPLQPAATSPLQVTSLVVSPSQISLGGQFSVNAAVSGGVTPYTYTWSGLPSPCSPGNVSSFQCRTATTDGTGSYTVGLLVLDANGSSARNSGSLMVNPDLTITGITISPNPVSEGSSFGVNVQVSGGVPPYTYDWNPIPPGCPSQNTSSWGCSVGQTGEFPIVLTVHDSQGSSTGISRSINVTSSGNQGGNGGTNGTGNQQNSSDNNNNNNSNGFNISSFGPLLFYGLIAGIVVFALLVALTVGVLLIAVILARRLPKPVKGSVTCAACQAKGPPGAKFCPSCAAPLAPPK